MHAPQVPAHGEHRQRVASQHSPEGKQRTGGFRRSQDQSVKEDLERQEHLQQHVANERVGSRPPREVHQPTADEQECAEVHRGVGHHRAEMRAGHVGSVVAEQEHLAEDA